MDSDLFNLLFAQIVSVYLYLNSIVISFNYTFKTIDFCTQILIAIILIYLFLLLVEPKIPIHLLLHPVPLENLHFYLLVNR